MSKSYLLSLFSFIYILGVTFKLTTPPLNDKSGKMSKSKGDSKDLNSLIEKGYDPIVYRYFCLQSHYRKVLVYSLESLDMATNAYNKLKSKIKNIKDNISGDVDYDKALEYQDKFKEAFENDINTSLMLTTLYDVIKSDLNNNTKLYLIKDFDSVLSLSLLEDEKISKELEDYVLSKIEERNQAKKEKNYALADSIRDELLSKNIVIKDTREGTTFEVRK